MKAQKIPVSGELWMPEFNKFSSPEIELAFLMKASPEYVYEWMRKNAGPPGSGLLGGSPYSEELVKNLKSRANLIIDLALAQYADQKEVLKELYANGDLAIRIAVVANEYRDSFWYDEADHPKWMTEAQFGKLLNTEDYGELRAFFGNHRFKQEKLEAVFLRAGIYSKIPYEKWRIIVACAMENPNITLADSRDSFAIDGFTDYLDSKPLYAVWKMLSEFPNTLDNASLLCGSVEGICSFHSPLRENKKKSKQNFLKKILDRWTEENATITDDQKEELEEEKKNEYSMFKILRENIASKVPIHEKGLIDYIKNHEDTYVRRGYYRIFRPHDPEEVESLFKKDGKHFVEGAVLNKNLYNIRPKGVCVAFSNINQDLSEKIMEFHEIQWAQGRYEYMAKKLSEENPDIYKFDSFQMPLEEDDADNGDGQPTLQSKMTSINEKIGVLVKEVSTEKKDENIEKILQNLSRMNVLLSDEISKINNKIDEISKLIRRSVIWPILIIIIIYVIFRN